jgi:flavin-dependent dehydrogenase
MQGQIRNVAIIGDGPGACVVGTLIARAGVRTAIYSRGTRPDLVVGESLVPAVVPILRKLGIEKEVSRYSTYKPGATFMLTPPHAHMSFDFSRVDSHLPPYAYNVPRDRFDASLINAAEQAGVRIVVHTATLERVADSERVRLDPASLAALDGWFEGQPDLIVDATGRARLLPKLLGIPFDRGERHDQALFAHRSHAPLSFPGHVHTDRLRHGWCWRIPLPGRVSVGIVVNGDIIREYGATPEERYDNYLKSEPWLSSWSNQSERLTPVVQYTNYQLASQRVYGDGWVLVGDTAGFVDPVFSSGLYLAMDGACVLASTILDGAPKAFARYQRHVQDHIRAWQRIVSYYYSGRLFTLFRAGDHVQDTMLGRALHGHMNKHMGRIFTGAAGTRRYSLNLLRFMTQYGLYELDPENLRVAG